MKNSFALLGTGDQVDPDYNTVEGKEKKKDRPVNKKPVEEDKPKVVRSVNANLPPDNLKEEHRPHKSDREQKPKDLYDHRLHDRHSANAKPDQPRKQGGGAHNIGNMKDELNQDRILSKVKEDNDEAPQEPKEPQKPTLSLEQYYQQQGISIESVEKQLSKEEKEKNDGPIEAEWIAKEKLTLMKTKEDTNQDRKPAVLSQNEHKVEPAPEQELLGFKSYDSKKPREEKEKPTKGGKPQGKKANKPVINEEDFPAL